MRVAGSHLSSLIQIALAVLFSAVTADSDSAPGGRCPAADPDCNELPSDPLDNKLTFLWATPILKRQLLPANKALDDPSNLNGALATMLLSEFEEFKATGDWSGKSSSRQHSLNEAFFEMQRRHYDSTGQLWAPLQRSAVVQQLLSTIRQLAVQYLDAIGSPSDKQNQHLGIFMWAGVHEDCMAHMAHTHPQSAVSGTYYVAVPPSGGDLVLEDPRGPLPPFQQRIVHRPRSGGVILFPSWLQHSVSPTCDGNGARIALSFNVIGEWTQTSDATTVIYEMGNS